MKVFSTVVAALALLALAAAAQASIVNGGVTQLTDTAQINLSTMHIGYLGNPDNGAAIDFGTGNTGRTFRGMHLQADTYGANAVGIQWTVAGPGWMAGWDGYGGGGSFTGTDANTLTSMLNDYICPGNGPYGDAGSQAYTFTGLTVGQAYTVQIAGTVQSLANWTSIPNELTVDIDATPGVDADMMIPYNSYLYSANFTATSTSATITLNGPRDGSGYTSPGAMFLSPAVPEPATMSLLAVGALGALIRRRK